MIDRVGTSIGMSQGLRAIYDRVTNRDSDWITGSLTKAFDDAARPAVSIRPVESHRLIEDEQA